MVRRLSRLLGICPIPPGAPVEKYLLRYGACDPGRPIKVPTGTQDSHTPTPPYPLLGTPIRSEELSSIMPELLVTVRKLLGVVGDTKARTALQKTKKDQTKVGPPLKGGCSARSRLNSRATATGLPICWCLTCPNCYPEEAG